MNREQQLQKELADLEKLERVIYLKKIKEDPWLFITGYPGKKWKPGESKGCVFTKDEHDKNTPFKHFPNKENLFYVAERWLIEDKLVIPKSRQIMMSWLMVTLHLWLFLFHPGQLIFFQSKKEKDANKILDRAKFIYDHLPDDVKEMSPVKKIGGKWSYLKMEARDTGANAYSVIEAIPQGADVLRSNTSSAILSDETAFQDKAEDCYNGAKPTLDGGGKYTAISSVNGKNFFYKLASGEMG